MKTTSPHEGNLRDERIKNSGAQFFLCVLLSVTLGVTRGPRRNVHFVILSEKS